MPHDENRGTGLDSTWKTDLTGGNDSGTADVDENAGNEANGPDRTAQIAEAEGISVAGPPRRTAMQADDEEDNRRSGAEPAVSSKDADPDTVTDESGRIASAYPAGPDDDRGGANDPSVTGIRE